MGERAGALLRRRRLGLSRPGGVVSEDQWQDFLRDEVTPCFPAGLAVVEARGQPGW